MAFFCASLWGTISKGKLPDNPFLNVVGYAFSIDWSATPWQLLGVVGSVLSLVVIYLVDWTFRKYRVAKDTQDAALADEALRHFGWIERLARARTLVFLAYCAIVGLHGLLVVNARVCWFDPTPSIQSWAKVLYQERTPGQKCAKVITH